MFKKIKVIGQGGQGVKYLTVILGTLFDKLDYSSTLVLDYDSAVRGGSITADLIISKKDIKSPIIDTADIVVNMEEGEIDNGKSILKMKPLLKQAKIEFDDVQENMFYLGRIMNSLDLPVKDKQLKSVLKNRKLKANLKSIELGYKVN